MSDKLLLKSINGQKLTDKLINSWFDANEIFITRMIYSDDRYSAEVTFVDEERTEMLADLLSTCYGHCISIERPQAATQSLDGASLENEYQASPGQLSAAMSNSSKSSCLSRRLITVDTKKSNDDHTQAQPRRLPDINAHTLFSEAKTNTEGSDFARSSMQETNKATSYPYSTTKHNVSTIHGLGRGFLSR